MRTFILITLLIAASSVQAWRARPEWRRSFEDELLDGVFRRSQDDPPEDCLLEEEIHYDSSRRTDCDYLQIAADALIGMFEANLRSRGLDNAAYMRERAEVQAWLQAVIDIDVFNEGQRRDLACELADAETVREASYLLHMSQSTFLTHYMRLKSFFDVIGGPRNLKKRLMVAVELAEKLREISGQGERTRVLNTTLVYENLTERRLVTLLRELESEFGPGFLIDLTLSAYDEHLIVTDLSRWATALLGPVDDVPCLTGLTVEQIRQFLLTVDLLVVRNSLRTDDADILGWTATTIKHVGLLDLQLE